MTPLDCGLDGRATEEFRPAENEDLHLLVRPRKDSLKTLGKHGPSVACLWSPWLAHSQSFSLRGRLAARACAAFVALKVLVWNDRRSADDLTKAGKMARLKRRETQVSIIRAAITYLGFGTAAVLSIGQLIGGVDRLTAIAGASFVLILVGFAVQRVLMDIIAGLAMFIERWYSVGDTIQIPMHELQGVVEDLSLRHTRLRTLDGEMIHIHNSQIPSVRVLPAARRTCGSRSS